MKIIGNQLNILKNVKKKIINYLLIIINNN